MPDPWERHSAASAWDWGAPGSRSQERQAAASDQLADPAPAKAPGSVRYKDKDLCKGVHPNAPHNIVTVFKAHAYHKSTKCYWYPSWGNATDEKVRWSCFHHRVCADCGKFIRYAMHDECEFYPGTPEQKAAAETRHDQRLAEIAAQGGPQRRGIGGRYRKPSSKNK
jgi:hypothetical protein